MPNCCPSPRRCGADFSHRKLFQSLFDIVVITDTTGRVITEWPVRPNEGVISVADRAYFQKAMRTGEATASGIPMEVLHRVASMASGGMDTLPHNGAVITLLMVTGLTHRTSYKDIFAITCIKTSAVFVVIALYYLTGLV